MEPAADSPLRRYADSTRAHSLATSFWGRPVRDVGETLVQIERLQRDPTEQLVPALPDHGPARFSFLSPALTPPIDEAERFVVRGESAGVPALNGRVGVNDSNRRCVVIRPRPKPQASRCYQLGLLRRGQLPAGDGWWGEKRHSFIIDLLEPRLHLRLLCEVRCALNIGGSRLGILLRRPSVERAIDAATGTVLIGFGVKLGLSR